MPSTPRQLALYQALIRIGVAEWVPEFAHLPTVLGEGTKKLSKRDPQSNLFAHRDRGFIPEGLLNYLALLGWAIADDHDLFTLDDMVAAFDVVDVNSNPARFDQKKADALNAEHIRMLDPDDFARRLRDYFYGATAITSSSTPADFATAAHLVQTRIVVLGDAWDLLKFLNDDEYAIDPKAAAKELGPGRDRRPHSGCCCAGRCDGLRPQRTSRTPSRPRSSTIWGSNPARPSARSGVAATGTTISPPLFESLELLGRDRSLRAVAAPRASIAV